MQIFTSVCCWRYAVKLVSVDPNFEVSALRMPMPLVSLNLVSLVQHRLLAASSCCTLLKAWSRSPMVGVTLRYWAPSSVPVYCQSSWIWLLAMAWPIAGSAALVVSSMVKLCLPSSILVMAASNASSVKDLAPIFRLTPAPSVDEVLVMAQGLLAAPPELVVAVGVADPQAGRIAPAATADTAKSIRPRVIVYASVEPRWSVSPLFRPG